MFLQLIIFVVFIIVIISSAKKNPQIREERIKRGDFGRGPATGTGNGCRQVQTPAQPGKTARPSDKPALYRRFIERDRYESTEKIARELSVTNYQVVREIKDLQSQGYFTNVRLDEKNNRLIYLDGQPVEKKMRNRAMKAAGVPAPPAGESAAVMEAGEEEESTLEYLSKKAEEDRIEHEREESELRRRMNMESARSGYIPGKRLPDWGGPKPDEQVAVCGYCGAENVLPKTVRDRYSCYFCREEL